MCFCWGKEVHTEVPCLQRTEEDANLPGVDVTDSCNPLYVGARNQTPEPTAPVHALNH